MLKITALLFNTIALLIYQLFFTGGVTVSHNIPASAEPGTDFTVELTINKGSVAGFAKLQLDLPEGFTAVVVEKSTANFAYVNNAAKFIWMSIPSDEEFKVSLTISVPAGATGDKTIAGTLSYILDNGKQKVPIEPVTIQITPDGAPAFAGGGGGTEGEPAEPKEPEPKEPGHSGSGNEGDAIDVYRTIKGNTTSPGEFTVEITIKKGNTDGFAKIIDRLPAGFTASVGDPKGAVFSFIDQRVKYVWGTLPEEEEFKISYTVNVDEGITGEQNIEGLFSFIENDRPLKFVLPATIFTMGEASSDPVAQVDPPVSPPIQEDPVEVDPNLGGQVIAGANSNVTYKVQVLALIEAVNKAKPLTTIANILNVDQNRIKTVPENGWKKFRIGQYSEYKMARDARESLPSEVAAPFVVAYNGAKHITVQDALMITSQKWWR